MRFTSIAFAFTSGAIVAALVSAVPAQAAVVTCRGVKATIVGTSSTDVIRGTAHRDVIAGLGGSDRIFAGAGNDLVCGGEGADQLYGGAGADRLYGELDQFIADPEEDGTSRTGDTLHGGPGDDRLYAGVDRRNADDVVLDAFSWDTSGHGVRIDLRTRTARGDGADTFASDGLFTVVGSAHGDVVEGTDRRDLIEAGPGPDVVRARGGSDLVTPDGVGNGPRGDADEVWGGAGNDRINARQGQDRIDGGPGSDWIETRDGHNDVLIGGDGDDHFWTQITDTRGPQEFRGGRGTDYLQINTDVINPRGAASTGVWNMATGALRFTLGDRKIALLAYHIDRAILATTGTSWRVKGTSDDDFVSTNANDTAPVTFDGLAGNDGFIGTDGDDVFNGGPGRDRSFGMYGGDDTCTSVEVDDLSDCEHVS